MLQAFFHGFVLALGLILPLGAQNVFIFNQGASQPKLKLALPAVLTACLCDTLLIGLSVLGVALAVLQFAWLQILLYTVGLFFLLYMGYSVWKTTPGQSGEASQPSAMKASKQIAFAASVSLLNPHAILDTIGVIGTSSLVYEGLNKGVFSLTCIAVSWLWFVGLALAGRMTGRMDASGRWMRLINRVSAVIIWGVALFIGSKLVLLLLGS